MWPLNVGRHQGVDREAPLELLCTAADAGRGAQRRGAASLDAVWHPRQARLVDRLGPDAQSRSVAATLPRSVISQPQAQARAQGAGWPGAEDLLIR